MRIAIILSGAVGALCLAQAPAEAQTHGLCRFDPAALSFAGDARQQARCLLRPVLPYAHTGPERDLPENLGALVGEPVGFEREDLARILRASGNSAERALAATLATPLSRARNNAAGAPLARYFVIHDTSTPNLGVGTVFPSDIDRSDRVNTFSYYPVGNGAKAHFFVNRRGDMRLFQDFSVPWRATKLELRRVGTPSKGLFLHIELVQPRFDDRRGIDAVAPQPGFTQEQYDRLALLYAVASRRSGRWLIPGFHGLVDAQIDGGHDDPQFFDLARFDLALGALLQRIASRP